ncbi:MAG: ABC-2 transporter permease [Solibacillus sp.]
MKAILQLHWSMHHSLLLFCFAFVALFLGFFITAPSEISLLTMAIIFSGSSARNSLAILKQNNSQQLLYTMPIPHTAIIKSLYIVNFSICTAVFLLVAPSQFYNGFLNNSLFTYVFAWIGFYCGCLLGTLFLLIIYLDDAKIDNGFVAFFTLLASIGFTFIPHTILSFATDGPVKWLLVFITPFIALIIYYLLMQNGVKRFANRPLL